MSNDLTPTNYSNCSIKTATCIAAGLLLSSIGKTAAQDTIYPTNNVFWLCNSSNIAANEFCQQDDRTVEVFIQSSINATGQSNIWSQLLNQYDPTDLIVQWDSTPTYSGANETDIIYQRNANVPVGFNGVTWCEDSVTTIRCDQHYVAFDTATPGWEIACHESGHAMGLTHGQHAWPALVNTAAWLECMRTPTPAGSWQVSALNTTNLNGVY